MKGFKWKTLFITTMICLLPILLGISLWDRLPDTMAIHFNLYGEADGFASKWFVVFGLPIIMAMFQAFGCIATDINTRKYNQGAKIEMVSKWIIPFITAFLYVVTLGYALGWNLDVGKVASFAVGVVFLVTGNYMPKLDYIKSYKIEPEKAKKINRFVGYETVIMGVLFLVSIFFPPEAAAVCLVLLIPYAIIGAIYGIMVNKGLR